MLGISLLISWKVNNIQLPTNTEKWSAVAGFMLTTAFFVLAVLNRIGNLFKVKSMGFVFMFAMFLGMKMIIDPVVWTVGLLCIPLLIDDLIFQPIWKNIWYNEYDSVVKIKE